MFTHQPNKEFVAKMNGYKMTEELVSSGATFLPPSNIGDLPDTVDWRSKGYVTPIKNQVSGRCTSHPSKTRSVGGARHIRPKN